MFNAQNFLQTSTSQLYRLIVEELVALDLIKKLEMHFEHTDAGRTKIYMSNRDFCRLAHEIIKHYDSLIIAQEAQNAMSKQFFAIELDLKQLS